MENSACMSIVCPHQNKTTESLLIVATAIPVNTMTGLLITQPKKRNLALHFKSIKNQIYEMASVMAGMEMYKCCKNKDGKYSRNPPCAA